MNRNVLYIVVGVVVVVAMVIGYRMYQDRQTTGVQIDLGKSGISIQKN